MNPTWNVYIHDINSRKLEIYNVFDHYSYLKGLVKICRIGKSREDISEEIRKETFYWFGSKCEWEIVLTSWPPYIKNNELDVGVKIDVYDQLRLNWGSFINYILDHQKEIQELYKKRNKK